MLLHQTEKGERTVCYPGAEGYQSVTPQLLQANPEVSYAPPTNVGHPQAEICLQSSELIPEMWRLGGLLYQVRSVGQLHIYSQAARVRWKQSGASNPTCGPTHPLLEAAATRFLEVVLRPPAPLLCVPGNPEDSLFSSQERFFRSQVPFVYCPPCSPESNLASIPTSLNLFLSGSPKISNG